MCPSSHVIFVIGGVPQEHGNSSSENRTRAHVLMCPSSHVIFVIGGVPQEHGNSSENRDQRVSSQRISEKANQRKKSLA